MSLEGHRVDGDHIQPKPINPLGSSGDQPNNNIASGILSLNSDIPETVSGQPSNEVAKLSDSGTNNRSITMRLGNVRMGGNTRNNMVGIQERGNVDGVGANCEISPPMTGAILGMGNSMGQDAIDKNQALNIRNSMGQNPSSMDQALNISNVINQQLRSGMITPVQAAIMTIKFRMAQSKNILGGDGGQSGNITGLAGANEKAWSWDTPQDEVNASVSYPTGTRRTPTLEVGHLGELPKMISEPRPVGSLEILSKPLLVDPSKILSEPSLVGVTPFARKQIEGHLSALRSLVKEHNCQGNVLPMHLSFNDGEDRTRVWTVMTRKEIVDADLKKPLRRRKREDWFHKGWYGVDRRRNKERNTFNSRDGLVMYHPQAPYQAPRADHQRYHNPRVNLNSLTKQPKEILASELQLNLQPPRPMQLPPKKENQDRYCDYHGEKGCGS
nr:hypothetical protein [Tanacetum cinerariifolium]